MIPAIEMKLIDIDSIHVDPAYQRDLDEKRVKKLPQSSSREQQRPFL